MTPSLDNSRPTCPGIAIKQAGTARLFLGLAIASEVVGLMVLQANSIAGAIGSYVLFFLLVALSYVFLALALKGISVGVAYAIWEGSGIAIITLISAAYFQQALSILELVGLAMACVGILLVKAGELDPSAPSEAVAEDKGNHDVNS